MCKIIGIDKYSRVLDPCCGSGSFLVRALTDAIDSCSTEKEKENVKKSHIYGIEYEDTAFGLAATNMLIHGDGNTNVRQGNCFENIAFIKEANINRVLMNPPYNAQKKHCKKEYVAAWGTNAIQDPSKGFHFVYEIAKAIRETDNFTECKLAVLLPMQCAIGTSNEIKKFKELMLNENALLAVFSLPPDMFHPGASANACCMVFDIGKQHNKPTFFGFFKDDGFVKKKNLGRVEKKAGIWGETEKLWLELVKNNKEVEGLSAIKFVNADDEWLAEAYMETDYSTLSDYDFEVTIRNFIAYQIANGCNDA